MSNPKIFGMIESPPCRFVSSVAKILGVELELVNVDLTKKEQHNEEFAKFLPFKKIPSFVDSDGFTMSESRAIGAYLVQTRAPNSPLYPTADVKKRALIDQYLQFDLGALYKSMSDVVYPMFTTGKPDLDKMPQLVDTMERLDASFTTDYLTGDEMTIADLSVYFSITLLDVIDIDWTKAPKVRALIDRLDAKIQELDGDGKFAEGRKNLAIFCKSKQTEEQN